MPDGTPGRAQGVQVGLFDVPSSSPGWDAVPSDVIKRAMLRGGSGALDEMQGRAQSLGIVLDEHLVRDAERARTELDTLAQVISANLTRAA